MMASVIYPNFVRGYGKLELSTTPMFIPLVIESIASVIFMRKPLAISGSIFAVLLNWNEYSTLLGIDSSREGKKEWNIDST